MAIYRGPGGAGDATVDATNATAYVALKTQEATDAATAAAASAAEAAASAVIASTGLDGIAAYAAAAAGSAASASDDAAAAAVSAEDAAISAANANEDAGTASTKANEASASADDAAASAASAANSANNLNTAVSSASASATAAAASASSAANSASDAAESASLAASAVVDDATPTVSGVVFGRTDAGTYAPPTTISYGGTVDETSYTIAADTNGDFLGDVSAVKNAITNNILQVGMPFTITCFNTVTNVYEALNCGTITALNNSGAGFVITFSNAVDFSNMQRATIFWYSKLLVQSISITGNVAENVTLGQNAGTGITTGGENVLLGAAAGNNVGSGRNNVVIGNAATASAQDVSNEVTLGNSSHTKTRIFGALAVGGSSTGTSGQVLTSGGSSAAPSWTTFNPLPSQSGNSGKYLTTDGTAASWVPLSVDAATPTVTGTLFGRTDSGTYSPATNITNGNNGYWFSNPSAYSIYSDLAGDYNGPGAPGDINGAVGNGTIQVGMNLTLVCNRISTGLQEAVNMGVITSIVTGGSGAVTITGTNAINWSLYQNSGVWFGYKLIVNQLSLGGLSSENVTLGYSAGQGITTGGENVIIGDSAGNNVGTGRNNVVIGNAATASAQNVSNEITLGNSSHTKTRLFGALALGGSSTGTAGQVLTSQGSGSTPTWTTAGAGTVTSVALTAPTGLTVIGSPVTTSGTLALSYTAGYSIPTDTKQTNWDTAYGWGNHASAGYASTSGSYSNPSWITSLAYSKLTGTPTIDTLVPTQTGNGGKYLTTNGSAVSWASVSSLSPDITVNSTAIGSSYTISSGKNGFSVGPVTLSNGVTVTVSAGQRWVIL